VRENLVESLWTLSRRRPLFHSEADFQHELAWQLRAAEHASAIRLERPFHTAAAVINVDLLVTAEEEAVAIELKYWKKGLEREIDGERFLLKNRGAHDLARYDFWKDVTRLERLRDEGHLNRGYVVALTNDPAYWQSSSTGRVTVDAAFRIHHGRRVGGALAWSDEAGPGTTRGRASVLELRGSYVTKWKTYSTPAPGVEFRFLLLEV